MPEKLKDAYKRMGIKVPKNADMVNAPPHYTKGGIECIDALRAWLPPDEYVGFLRGNAIKYLCRLGDKGKPEEDAAKASWYAKRLADTLKGIA